MLGSASVTKTEQAGVLGIWHILVACGGDFDAVGCRSIRTG